jgi:hypothetical protein
MATSQYSKMTAQHREYALELIRNEGLLLKTGSQSEKRIAKRRVIENFVERFPHDRHLIEVLSQGKGASKPANPLQTVTRLLSELKKVQEKEDVSIAAAATRRLMLLERAEQVSSLMQSMTEGRDHSRFGARSTRARQQQVAEHTKLFKDCLQTVEDLRSETDCEACDRHVQTLLKLIDDFCTKFPHFTCCIDYKANKSISKAAASHHDDTKEKAGEVGTAASSSKKIGRRRTINVSFLQ